MGALIPDSVWTTVRGIIRDAHDTFNQDTITWVSHTQTTVARYNEDDPGYTPTNIELKCLLGYNYFRTWPMSRFEEEGEIDEENMIVLFNKDYLSDLGYLTSEGYFNYKGDRDLFIHRGIKYRPAGDTLLSQAKDNPLFLMVILRREVVPTGTDRLNQS